MLLYAYYNADLMDIAKGKSELPTGFMDDCAFVAVADTIDETHVILKNMIEHTNSGLDWSLNHNSPFELSKQAVMNFTRDTQDIATSPLQLVQTNPDGTTTTHTIDKVDKYKYLGIIFDHKLTWRAHILKVIASVTKLSQ